MRFIDHHAGDDEPFLCYVPFNAPHSPFQAKDSDLMLYKQLPPARGSFQGATGEDSTRVREQRNSNRRVLGATFHLLDQAVGRIVDAIERNGILENTFILFSSDNGGVRGIGENTPLCGAKATVFEGGIRVPAAVRWYGMIPGGRKINEPLANIDVFPTVMRLAGVEQSVGKPLDGVDMLDILTGKQEKLERELFNYIGQSGLLGEQISYMTNDWKMIVIGPVVTDENADDADRQKFLFNISKDISEENNLVDQNPARAATMYKKIKWFRSLQPEEAVPPYNEGRDSKSFKAPHQWEMSDD